MASFTISSDTYYDQLVGLTGGDTFTVNEYKTLTIRTDTRQHANSPASCVGTLGTVNIYGKLMVDATNVRWLPFEDGSSTVPAPGTVITGMDDLCTGILLGVWGSLTSAPSATGAAMPSTGFMKFLSVDGPFLAVGQNLQSPSAYLGMTTGVDVTGWIEIAGDTNYYIQLYYSNTKEIETNGDWFYLDSTTGSKQNISFPTNGSSTSGSYGSNLPGLWVETDEGSDEYEFWQAVTTANYFDEASLGMPTGESDERQKFVFSGTSYFTFGEDEKIGGTYSHTPATGKTYTESGGYITVSSSGHHFVPEDYVYLDFDPGSSGAAFDGQYQITSTSGTSTFTVYIAGMIGLGGGSGLSHSSYCVITSASHGLPTKKKTSLAFDSTPSMDGSFYIYYKDTNTFRVNFPYNGSASGNVDIVLQLGHLPPANCRTRIPNIICRTSDPSSRANNYANGGSSPYQWQHATSGFPRGKITLNYITGDNNFYFNYSPILSINDSSFMNYFNIAYAIVDDPINNCGFTKGGSNATCQFSYIDDITFTNCVFWYVSCSNSATSRMYNCRIAWPRPLTSTLGYEYAYFENCEFVCCTFYQYAKDVVFESCDFCCSASIGYHNSEYLYCLSYLFSNSSSINAKSLLMNNITFGKNNTIDDQLPANLATGVLFNDVTLTNFGSKDNYIKVSPNALRSSQEAPGTLIYPSTISYSWKFQRIFIEYLYYGIIGTSTYIQKSTITDIHVLNQYYKYSYIPAYGNKLANINTGPWSSSPSSSVQNFSYPTFGTNWFTVLNQDDDTKGDLYCVCMVSGSNNDGYVTFGADTNMDYDQYGALIMTDVGQSVVFETHFPIMSFSAFENTAATISGTNTGNFTITYAIKSGDSYPAYKTLSAANLSAESINPYLGFNMKIKIECNTAGTSNKIKNIQIPMTTSSVYQHIYYPLEGETEESSTSDCECLTTTDIASAVRTELATELGLISSYIDATISSRLAAADYVEPLDAADTSKAVWDEATASWANPGTFGKLTQDIKTETASIQADTNSIEAKVDIIDGLVDGITSNVETIKSNVNDILADTAAIEPLVSANLDEPISDIPTAEENADAVWDEVLSGATHNVPSSAGRKLRQLASDVVLDGMVQSATSNTVVLDGDASSLDGSYDPGYIIISNGLGAGQTRIITEYRGSTKTAVINRAWKITPDITSEYVIMGYADIQSVNEGLIRAATANTAQLNALASTVDDTYRGQLIFITSGTGEDQTAVVLSYNGATQTATIDGEWAITPDTTSNYVMLPASPVLLAGIEHSGAIIPKVKEVEVSLVNL